MFAPCPAPIRRRLGALVWVALAVAALPLIRGLDDRLDATGSVEGTPSAEVERRIAHDFDTPFGRTAVLVVSGLGVDPASDSGRALVRTLVAPIAAHPAVRSVVSSGASLDTMLVGTDQATAIALVGLRPPAPGQLDSLRALGRRIQASLRADHPHLTIRWTGQPFLIEDLRAAGSRAARRAELLALPASALVAAWAFGSLAGLATGMAAAIVTVLIGLGIAGALSMVMPLSPLTRAATSLVGVALSLDYVLFRLRRPEGGSRRMVRLAGIVVAIGYAGLAIAPTGELRSAAIAGIGVAVVASLVAIAFTGVIRPGRASGDPGPGDPGRGDWDDPRRGGPTARPAGAGPNRWLGWGRWITRHPWLVVLLAGLPVGLLAGAAWRARLLTPLERWLPADAESTVALGDLERAGRLSALGTLRVLLTLPPDAPVLSAEGWRATRQASAVLGGLPGAAGARSITTIGTGELVVAREVFPEAVRHALVSLDGRTAIIDLLPDPRMPRDSAVALVRRIRGLEPRRITGAPGATLLVAGLPAYALDYQNAVGGALPAIVLAIAGATFLALTIGLGAPVLALKAVTLNLLVAAAAIGATVLVFQDGFGIGLLGREALGSVLPTVPVVAFGLAFGLSMDY